MLSCSTQPSMMWFAPRSIPHDGTAPAAPLTTPFDFPCGRDFYDSQCTREPCFRPSCAPPNFQEYWWSTVGYYSPAVCPAGYTVGCSRWDARQGPRVEKTEHAMMCVPSGYTCGSDLSFASSATAKAPMIQIRWAESDLPSLETHPTLPGVPARETAKLDQDWKDLRRQVAPSFSSDTGSDDASTESTIATTGRRIVGGGAGGAEMTSGLSNGAKIGLAAGCSVGVLLLLVLGGYFLYLYRKNRLEEREVEANPLSIYLPDRPELPGQERAEIDGQEKKPPAGSDGGSSPVSEGPGMVRRSATVVSELDAVRSESQPSEQGGDPGAHGAEAPPSLAHELAAYPYAQGPSVPGQAYLSNEQYGPHPQQKEGQTMPKSASPQPHAAYTQQH